PPCPTRSCRPVTGGRSAVVATGEPATCACAVATASGVCDLSAAKADCADCRMLGLRLLPYSSSARAAVVRPATAGMTSARAKAAARDSEAILKLVDMTTLLQNSARRACCRALD